MSVKKIIPCLDMKNGRVVKGVKFVNIRDAGDPVESAKEYIREGADELVLLDISASLERRKTMIDVVKKVAAVTTIPFTVGGGMRSMGDIKDVLDAGADKVSINTAAVENPGLIKEATEKFGKKVIVAIDVQKNENMSSGYEVLIYGGEKTTGKDVVEWAKEAVSLGAIAILPTSKDRDGTKDGYDLEITRKIKEAIDVPVIASGGVGNLKHILDGLTKGKADAALAASIFHFKEYTVKDIKDYLKKEGVAVRDAMCKR